MIQDQPPPVSNNGPDVWELVIADMHDRRLVGIARHDMPLRPHNGRNALIDAYQECLDQAVYLRQAIEERSLTEQVEVTEEWWNKAAARLVKNDDDETVQLLRKLESRFAAMANQVRYYEEREVVRDDRPGEEE